MGVLERERDGLTLMKAMIIKRKLYRGRIVMGNRKAGVLSLVLVEYVNIIYLPTFCGDFIF